MKQAIKFLAELSVNNDRDWYNAHKEEAKTATAEFATLVADLQSRMSAFIPGLSEFEPKDLIYRLSRDVRFSKDKTPYNPTFRALLSSGGKKVVGAGCFFGIDGEAQAFLGSGFHGSDNKAAVAAIRDALVKDASGLDGIVKNYEVKGDKLKRVPAGYDADSPVAELLKHKSWHIEREISLSGLTEKEMAEQLTKEFHAMAPFVDWLNEALTEVK